MTDTWMTRQRREWQARVDRGREQSAAPPDRGYLAWAGGTGLVLLVIAGLLAAAAGPQAGFRGLNDAATLLPPRFWSVLTACGDTAVALAALLLVLPRHLQLAWVALLSILLGLAATYGPKLLMPLPRPAMVLDPASLHTIGHLPDTATFPSGHSVTAGTLAAVFMLITRAPWQRACLIAGALAIALARVAVGVHWPVDVLVGLAAGFFCTLIAVGLAERWPGGVNSPVCAFVLALTLVAACLLIAGHPARYPMAVPFTRLFGAAALAVGIWHILTPAPATRDP